MDRLSLDSRWANGTRGRSLRHPSSRRCVGIRWEGVSLIDGDGIGGVVDGREEDKTMQKETARGQEWVRKGRRSVFPGGGGRGADMGFICQAGRLALAMETSYFPSSPCLLGGNCWRQASPAQARSLSSRASRNATDGQAAVQQPQRCASQKQGSGTNPQKLVQQSNQRGQRDGVDPETPDQAPYASQHSISQSHSPTRARALPFRCIEPAPQPQPQPSS